MAYAMTALTVASTAYGAYAQNQAGKAQQDIANRNAKLLDRSAADALTRGNEEALASRRRTRVLVGQQRAAAAAQGLDVNTGAPADLQNQAEAFGAQDEATIRRNAFNEAWGIRTQASNQRTEGRYARRAGINQAIGTSLGGMGQAYSYWRDERSPYMGKGKK
jgi:hypothetical protein